MTADHPPPPDASLETQYDLPDDQLKSELLYFVEDAIHNTPRSLQKALGPSEIGIECARRLGYKLLDHPEVNPGDGWLATIGTATHAWLEKVFTAANEKLGHERFLCEQRVTIGALAGEPVVGSTDLFDRVTGRAIDFKVMGKTTLTEFRRHGPSGQYRAQGQGYGRGWAALGYTVTRVCIWGLPRTTQLADSVFWSEPYDEQIAVDALTRVEGIRSLTAAMGTGALPVLPTADSYCGFCPYFRRGSDDLTAACPGHPTSRAAGPTSVEALIA